MRNARGLFLLSNSEQIHTSLLYLLSSSLDEMLDNAVGIDVR